MKKMFVVINALVLTAVVAASLMAQSNNNKPTTGKIDPNVLTVAQRTQKVSLGCKNPGSHQDVAKTPSITNISGKVIKKGSKLYWSATDGDKGNITLDGDLAPNASKQVMGSAGNGYNCQAWMFQ